MITDVFDAVTHGTVSLLRAQGAKPRKAKPHPRPTDKKPDRIGGRGEHSQEKVLAWLQARKPPPIPVESQRVDQLPPEQQPAPDGPVPESRT